MSIKITGWMEQGGKILSNEEIMNVTRGDSPILCSCGGEFYLEWDDCRARDHLGIIPGDCPPGKIVCNGKDVCSICPEIPDLSLDDAIIQSIRLRSDEGVVAFSGGVDSALVAAISGRPAVTVGISGCHDIIHSKVVAELAGLKSHTICEIEPDEIEPVLKKVLRVIPRKTPLDAAIAATLFFVARWASENGHKRVLAGQGADELFGGYARYLEPGDPAEKLKTDFESLAVQSGRDQAVASIHGTYVSCPYLDMRVVRASKALPPGGMVRDGIRKYPLRAVAASHMPEEAAFYSKKAMQYGSGVWKEIQRLARKNGYKNSVQRYIDQLINQINP
ncbi:asparagine synthase C-terminal domain-containing protein [Methanolacinia petrolearia]|uniref:asparagine synthase C-terminal domain-containing protein n=1 Tax=Methanolacinia petrolearia TaxID=54120 RepID=UPI003BA92186